MLVSIIIPSFRQPQFLSRAIESCLEQDYHELEVIVVDDHSRDASLALALSFAASDPRVRVIECGRNGGLGKARNVGLAHAAGEYLCFLDSDDYLLDGSISARIDALSGAVAEHGDSVVGVYGDWQHVGEAVNHPAVRAARSTMPVVSADTYTGENVFICSAPLVRRDAVMATGGFPEGLRMLEDFALWAKMIAAGAVFVPVHHVVATYRQRPNSMLRGDGVVVMADHVRVINDWVGQNGLDLADGGAMEAWLADATPFSHGRMSWNVPSMLGNFGGAAGAGSVQTGDRVVADAVVSTVDDFMSNAEASGLDQPWPLWVGALSPATASTLNIVVSSLEHCVQAVALASESTEPSTVAMFAADPTDWSSLWPLALAGFAVRPLTGLPSAGTIVDLSAASPTTDSSALFASGVELLWPLSGTTQQGSGAIVYVPNSLRDYPALDAWISTALHALADADLDPRIVCDPEMHDALGGYRSEFVSIESLRRALLVVSPTGAHQSLVAGLTTTVAFDPSVDGDHARTAPQLRAEIANLQ